MRECLPEQSIQPHEEADDKEWLTLIAGSTVRIWGSSGRGRGGARGSSPGCALLPTDRGIWRPGRWMGHSRASSRILAVAAAGNDSRSRGQVIQETRASNCRIERPIEAQIIGPGMDRIDRPFPGNPLADRTPPGPLTPPIIPFGDVEAGVGQFQDDRHEHERDQPRRDLPCSRSTIPGRRRRGPSARRRCPGCDNKACSRSRRTIHRS